MQALIANVNRGKGQRAFTSADFNPYTALDDERDQRAKAKLAPDKGPEFFEFLGTNLKS